MRGGIVAPLMILAVLISGCSMLDPFVQPTPIPTATATSTPVPPSPTPAAAPISMRLLRKEFADNELQTTGTFQDYINFYVQVTNNTNKDIRAFTGMIHFRDLFDRDIFAGELTYEEGLDAGATVEWARGIEYNQFIASHERLKDIALSDVSVVFDTQQILFSDGTRTSYP